MTMRGWTTTVVTAMVVVFTGGCVSAMHRECEPIREKFFYGKAMAERVAEFSRLDLDQQYNVYMCGMRTMHPPVTALIAPFAGRGADAIPMLATRLRESTDDSVVVNVLRVLNAMDVSGTYAVRRDDQLMEIIVTQVRNMDDETRKTLAVGMFPEAAE